MRTDLGKLSEDWNKMQKCSIIWSWNCRGVFVRLYLRE